MIDASRAEKMLGGFLGHSYFHRDPWISSDIGSFIMGAAPYQRGLSKADGALFWQFPADYPQRLKELIVSPMMESFSKAFPMPHNH